MNILDIIAKKRDAQKMNREEIDYLVIGFSKGRIPDYQMAAWLMAVYLNGMDAEETAWLTQSMLVSGDRLRLDSLPGRKIDKHSTGGVGDKVSLILAPLVATMGVTVPMISGRSLGHSGGTLDKLEAIAGFSTQLSVEQLFAQLEELGVCMIGQTEELVPADKKIYALRDATATIGSIPLITASILSKKLAEDLDGLVLDIKTGHGAFMQNRDAATALAQSLVTTAKANGLNTTAIVTDMDQPLGLAIGNWLETREAIQTLQGEGPRDLLLVTLHLGAHMLRLAGLLPEIEAGVGVLKQKIDSGAAFDRFKRLVKAQGGDCRLLDNPGLYPRSRYEIPIFAQESGHLAELNARTLGQAVVRLGGGREFLEDAIDYKAGIVLDKKIGDRIQKGDRLAQLYSDRPSVHDVAVELQSVFRIASQAVEPPPLIIEEITNH